MNILGNIMPILGASNDAIDNLGIGFGIIIAIIGAVIVIGSWSKWADASHKLEQGHQSHTGLIGAVLAVIGLVVLFSVMGSVGGDNEILNDAMGAMPLDKSE